MPSGRKERQIIAPERADFVRCLAETVAEDYQAVNGTDLEAILADSSIGLFYEDFPESFDGLLLKDEIGFRVICNLSKGNTQNSPRSRFTIAHELGHFFIDEHRIVISEQLMPSMGESAIKDNLMEREADLFASHLLLPSSLIRKAFKKAGGGLGGIRQVSSKFGTSMKCASIRYVGEDLVPCSISFRAWDGELRWKWFSQKLWLAGARKISETLVPKSSTEQLLRQGPDSAHEIVSSTTTARYVFKVCDGTIANEVFTEEAIALGEYGVLSLLTAQKENLPLIAETLERRFSHEQR